MGRFGGRSYSGVKATRKGGRFMNKLDIASAVALFLIGTANAQVRPGEPAVSQVPNYAIEGIVLGSRVKFDSSMYREYKCGPSEQFDGFTWCQRSGRDGERRGSFDAKYSILHLKDGTVVYANRYQQPGFLDASEADLEIQNYSRKFGESPRITKMPRRTGTSDAILATWGKVELEPLDDESVKLLGDGKSPRRGLLIDFLGNFSRSAQEGLPIYRIVGGAGFVWVSSFDQKGLGIVRFAAVDASTLQPGPVLAQPTNVPQNNEQQPSVDQAEQAAAIRAIKDVEPELASATKARSDAEATIARLKAELSTAITEKTEAELARTEAEKVAQQVRTDAEIARKKFEAAIANANSAKEEIEQLMTGSGTPSSYVKVIALLWICAIAIFLLLAWVLYRLLSALLRLSVGAATTDTGLEARNDSVEVVPLSPASGSSAETKPHFNQDDLVKQLAQALGVQDPVTPLPAEVPVDPARGWRAIEVEPQNDIRLMYSSPIETLDHKVSERIKYVCKIDYQQLRFVYGKIKW
jgi:hypothetical protein